MSDTRSTPDGAGEDNGGASFDETGGVLDALGSEDDRDQGAGPDEIGNPLRPGGQDGPVGDVADGQEPHLDPDADDADADDADADARNP